ncbi:hypothetical protein [Litoribacillus peritrichatus]|uniref:Uncharacterized protein n=1 Tax=Litoribacillus peritrichatus TaxID=718191 RepID=A0ABP7MQP5_9GAMM
MIKDDSSQWLYCSLIVIFTCVVNTAWAGGKSVFYDGEITFGFDDNLSKAQRERDIVEDHFGEASLAVAYHTVFSGKAAMTVKGFLSGEAFETVDSLNRASAGAEVSFRWQPSLGFLDPIYKLSLTAQVDEYDVDQRDSDVAKVQLATTKRITDRLTATLGGEYRYRDSDGSVFDTEDYRFFLNGDLMVTKTLALYSTYSYLYGDVTSTAQVQFCNGLVADDIYSLLKASTAIEVDEAFNEHFCGSWVSYRLDGQTNAVTVGLNQGFGQNYALDVSALWASVRGDLNNDYYRRIYRATFLVRF